MAKGALSLAALLFVVCSVLAKSASSASIATECVLVSNYDEANGDPLQGQLFDLWNRDITLKGVMLVDWEGYMGNPEVLYRLAPPEGASFPVTAAITVDQAPLVYFVTHGGGLLSNQDENGPSLEHTFSSADERLDLRISVNPDRDYDDDFYILHVDFVDTGGIHRTLDTPIYVCDQDQDRALDFEFFLDVSHDKTGFYTAHPEAIGLMQQIADDVAYYVADMKTDMVPAGTAVARVNFDPHEEATNPVDYRGFYLFSTGWRHGSNPEDIWSTGAPGSTRQTQNGIPMPIYSIGAVRPHPDGDRSAKNTTGWSFNLEDDEWWTISRDRHGSSPTGDCPPGETECDYYFVSFYSVMKHEILHALAYEPRYPLWQSFVDKGCIDAPDLMAYTGRCSPIVGSVHAWDPVLHKRQWNQGVELIDKFELLVMQAVGWELRETTPFMDLEVVSTTLKTGYVDEAYEARILIRGGVPAYNFSITSGSLPPGLELNNFTGAITGTSSTPGDYTFDVTVLDYDVDNAFRPDGTTATLHLTIQAPVSAVDALTVLYNQTGGDQWTNKTNWLTGSIDTWYGLIVDGNGDVTGINLFQNNLSGPIPPELGTLSQLRSIELSQNSLSGPLPLELGTLTELEFLSVFGNQLNGPLPPELGALTKLDHLQVGGNQFSGTLPPQWSSLAHLTALLANNNQLEGNIPESFGSMSNLLSLDVGNNPLMSGTLPLALTGLSLDFFSFFGTGLCEDLEPAFQDWLGTIAMVSSSGCTNVANEAEAAVPIAFALATNYPNPFNPWTRIRYGLPERASVQVSVYDALGRLVEVLVKGEQEAGWHEVRFEGSGLPSGVYFYRLEAGAFQTVRQMVLLQ